VTAKTKRPNQDIRPSQRCVIIPTIQPGGCGHQKTKTRLQALLVGSAAVDERLLGQPNKPCQHLHCKTSAEFMSGRTLSANQIEFIVSLALHYWTGIL
jgi:hypothetical protein